MENLQFTSWQSVILLIAYIAYLCWVMFGGPQKRKIKIRVYLIMTLLMVYDTIHEFNGIHTTTEYINIGIVLTVGFIKGIVLGKRKIVEKANGIWYMHHDMRYIGLWGYFLRSKYC